MSATISGMGNVWQNAVNALKIGTLAISGRVSVVLAVLPSISQHMQQY